MTAIPHRHLVRPRALLALALCVASLAGGVVATSPAAAETVKQQIADAQQQLRSLDSQAEAASEAYDAARIKLAAAHTAAASAAKAVTSAQQRLAALQSSVTAFAVAAYRGGGTNSVLGLVSDGSTGRYIDQLSSMQAISVSEARTLSDVEAAQRVESAAQATAQAALAKQQAATDLIDASRQKIQAAAAKEQQILSGLEAKEAAIIKAAKARAAKLAAEREQARLEAESQATQQGVEAIDDPVSPTPPPVISGSGGAAVAVQWAYAEIGKPYVWAAAGPDSFDCSGLTQYVWGKAGVYLGHYTGDQWNEGVHVSQDQLEPGDLVFFAYNTSDPSTIHHVGIYVGNGNMIDAPYTGVDVRVDPAFRSDYIGAVRP
ncbi:MAG TPA: C40 family peptidase [Mycobacteriales bacterium]|nr:C40 family peptidase [Mycobacteriales bacterium]